MINVRLRDWCHWWNLVFFDHGVIYIASDLMETDGVYLLKRRKRMPLSLQG